MTGPPKGTSSPPLGAAARHQAMSPWHTSGETVSARQVSTAWSDELSQYAFAFIVFVDQGDIGSIDAGLLVFLGVQRGDAEAQAAIQKNGWNDYVIIAKGNRLQHFINGLQTVDVTDEDPKKQVFSGIQEDDLL